MKKTISILMAVCMLFALAACGNDAGGNTPSETNTNPGNPTEINSQPTHGETDAPSTQEGSEISQADAAKVLVAYFSCTGTTKALAEYAADGLDADLYEITPVDPYSSDDLNYSDDDSRSTREMNDPNSRPAISGSVENMEQYDIVFIGYPIWWGEAPRIVSTFMESYDFSGKTVIPFCTSSSSGMGSSGARLEGLTNGATWLSGQRFGGGTSRSDMIAFINDLELGITAR